MKKIINGKRYDTGTAQEIGCWDSPHGLTDFAHSSETLYRKQTGEYFLYGEGGPMSQYAVPEGNNGWSGGERIMPLSFEEAREWAEAHLDADDYEAAFGEVEEDGSKVVVGFTVSASTAEKIKRRASAAGMNQSEWLTRLIEELE